MDPIPMGEIPAWHAARLGAGRMALTHGHEVVSWGELEQRARRRAFALREAGVRENDLVTLALPNGAAFYELTFALWKLGATPHVVSPRLPYRELAAILDTARPKLLVAAESEAARSLGGRDPSELESGSEGPLPTMIARHWKAMSSGGSTGRPKIIVDHMPGAIDPDIEPLRIPWDSCVVNPGPLYHNAPFAVTHRALFRGNSIVGMARFDPEETLQLIAKHAATWINMVPTMMLRIWRLPPEVRERYDLSSLRSVWHMAAPMPDWLKQAWIDWLGPERIWELYGGTEAQGTCVLSGEEWLQHRGSVGKPVRCEIRILNDAGEPCPPGEIGEIFIRPEAGPGTTYHYLGAEPRAADGGFESIGDFGWVDDDGYLYLADRRSDLILRGGANIYPAEVEAALMEHPAVDQAVVVGLADDDLGQRVHAIVRLRDVASLDGGEDALRAFVGERLAAYKTPSTYEFTIEDLRDDAGKVRRSLLRDERQARSA